jgi:hypothetical protein
MNKLYGGLPPLVFFEVGVSDLITDIKEKLDINKIFYFTIFQKFLLSTRSEITYATYNLL